MITGSSCTAVLSSSFPTKIQKNTGKYRCGTHLKAYRIRFQDAKHILQPCLQCRGAGFLSLESPANMLFYCRFIIIRAFRESGFGPTNTLHVYTEISFWLMTEDLMRYHQTICVLVCVVKSVCPEGQSFPAWRACSLRSLSQDEQCNLN